MRKAILFAIGGLALLAGCENPKKASIGPKWKGATYRIAFDTRPATPNPAGLTIPAIKWTANPDALEKRATLAVRFDASGATKSTGPVMDQMVMPPLDIAGAAGILPANYMDKADKDLAKLLGAYCMKGKVKLSVAIVRSSVAPHAGDAEVDNKRLSDWLPIEVEFKNPNKKC